jgi:ribosomal protein S18 acetylase RimI-like enzyme
MSQPTQITVRRLSKGDEDVVRALATREPRTALLEDDRTIFLVAFQGAEPVGFVLGYELPRRHGDASILCIYEIEVRAACRGEGVGTKLLLEVERIARERGIGEGWVLTDAGNEPANRLYAAVGGESQDVVEWDFRYAAR